MSFLSSCLPINSKDSKPPSSNCIFCNVTPDKFDIVAQNERLIAFTDRSPAARVHLLVIPRVHIANVKSLKRGDEELVKEMKLFGDDALDIFLSRPQSPPSVSTSRHGTLDSSLSASKTSFSAEVSGSRRFGFHIPPFRSVDHLHLHSLVLPFRSTMASLKYRVVLGDRERGYVKGWSWFVEWKQCCEILEKGGKVKVGSC